MAEYYKKHTTQIKLMLNKTTDADIIQHLEGVENKQGYIKDLIRKDTKGE